MITDKIEQIWEDALKEKIPLKTHLLHADLHPRNIIVNNKKITAIIDWGDITSGDAATDLCSLWMLFENKKIWEEALKIYGASDKLIRRSMGWAVFFGVVFLDTGLEGNPLHVEIRERVLRNLDRGVRDVCFLLG